MSRIDDLLREATSKHRVVGVTAAAATRDDILYQGAFGRMNGAEPSELHMYEIFRIASMTKPITSVAAKSATITLQEGVEGVLRASQISRDKVEDARNVLTEGDAIDVTIVSVDRKNRVLSLSVKAIEIDDEKSAIKDHKSDASDVSPGTIGDLIKAQMDKS